MCNTHDKIYLYYVFGKDRYYIYFCNMKIRIHSEPYYNNPAPKLTKKMFDWFWTRIFFVNRGASYGMVDILSIDIRINQALPYTPIHFYVTVTSLDEVRTMNMTWDMREGKYYDEDDKRKEHVIRFIENIKDNFKQLTLAEQRAYTIRKVFR